MSGDTSAPIGAPVGAGGRRPYTAGPVPDIAPVPILMYHSVGGTGRLAVRPEAFAEQMAYLRQSGFTPLPFGSRARPAERPVMITFDDGFADFHEHALPVLTRYGFTATLFVTTGWLHDAGPYAAGRPPGRMLTWRQLEEVAAAGVEIGAHGHSHAPLDQLGTGELREELRLSRALLQDRLGGPVHALAYPYGYSSARVRREARACGYAGACAVANAVMTRRHDLFAVPRLTVRAATTPERFARALDGRGFRTDHVLTKGYAVVRRSRYAARRLRGVA